MKRILVFAYGSNMCTQRMLRRAPGAKVVTTGYVSRYQFAYHKRSVDGSAKADAVFTGVASHRVWGVVYRLHGADKTVLDQHEFLGIGYDEQEIDVTAPNRSWRAWMYVARSEAIDRSLLPYKWYHELILQGAHQHRLPRKYIGYLRGFSAHADPDTTRQTHHRRLLDGR